MPLGSTTLHDKWDERKVRLGDSYFEEGNYEKSLYYYQKYLKNLKKSLPNDDDKVIMTNMKIGDIHVAMK